MKIQLKLAASLLLAICANLSAEASQYENKQCCEPLLRDCPSWAFDCEISLLYLQPSGSNLHYVAEAEPLPVPSPSWIIDDIRPDYHFGFEAYLKVENPCREGGVILDYTHFYSKDSDSKAVSSSDMVGPFFEIGPDALLYTRAKGTVVFHYDALNLDYSLPFNYGNCLHSNLYAGVGGARIKEHLFTNIPMPMERSPAQSNPHPHF